MSRPRKTCSACLLHQRVSRTRPCSLCEDVCREVPRPSPEPSAAERPSSLSPCPSTPTVTSSSTWAAGSVVTRCQKCCETSPRWVAREARSCPGSGGCSDSVVWPTADHGGGREDGEHHEEDGAGCQHVQHACSCQRSLHLHGCLLQTLLGLVCWSILNASGCAD